MYPLLAPLVLVAIGGCSEDRTVYPSLAPRAAEKLGFAEPVAPAAQPAAADPALDAQIAALTTRLAAVRGGFDQALAKARIAARAPGARTVGSDAWLDAQTALGGLDDWRAQASDLASETAGLASARAETLAPDYPALATLQAAADAESTRQETEIARLQASIPGA